MSGGGAAPGRWWGRRVEIPALLLATLLLAIAALGLILWSALNHRAFHLTVSELEQHDLVAQLPSIVSLSGGALIEGNEVEIGHDGAFFGRLLEDIAAAEESIHLETFVWWTGEICERVAGALASRAREGVEVRLLIDARGGKRMTDQVRATLERGGVELELFHPLDLRHVGRFNFRDHRKIAVFDGRIAYLFGHGFDQSWTGNAQDRDHVRDTFVRVRGPIVNQIQAVFFENWVQTTRVLPAGRTYLPELEPVGDTTAHLAWYQPIGDLSALEILYRVVLASAGSEVLIQNPYFVVDGPTIELFRRAVKRGVRVRAMLPATDATDHPIVQHASHQRFEELLEAGVEILEYHRTLLHQKVIVIDRVWSSVGSTNFDDRSFELNDEVQIGMLDRRIAAELIEAFERDAEHATVLTLERWQQRSAWHRLIDRVAYLFHEQL